MENHRITGLYVAPPIVLALAKHPAVAQYDLSSLKYIISAAAPGREPRRRLLAAPGPRCPWARRTALTELSPGTHVVPVRDMPTAPPARSANSSPAPKDADRLPRRSRQETSASGRPANSSSAAPR
ncbi:hypothetical protein ACRAWF_17325 [Streptomyces sp. L7]